MRRTKEEAEKTRQDLLDAALTIFSHNGYEATRLEDIAKAAGVTRGAIYHHFGGKDELFVALLDDASAISNKAIQKAIAEGGSLLKILSRILIYTFNLIEDDARFRQVMVLTLSTLNVDELARRKYSEAEELVDRISRSLVPGIESGELRPDLDPKNAARALLAYQNGLALLWFYNRDTFSVKENAEDMAQIYLYGIANN